MISLFLVWISSKMVNKLFKISATSSFHLLMSLCNFNYLTRDLLSISFPFLFVLIACWHCHVHIFIKKHPHTRDWHSANCHIHQITSRLLKKHFALFGLIDHFTLHHKLNYCYGFIQYKSVHSAASALRSQNHYVCGYKLKVSVADSWHQPVTITTEDGVEIDGAHTSSHMANDGAAGTSATATASGSGAESAAKSASDRLNMLDLNDDCLLHIFGMLNCIDLSAVDQTCTRFQRVAGDVFRKKHTAINLTVTNLPGWSNIGASQLTLLQIRSLFMAFGSKIEKLQVTAVSFKQENRYRVLDLIIRSCTALRTLILTGFYIKVCNFYACKCSISIRC